MASIERPAREFFRLALVALAYWLAARLSLNLALVHGQVTPIWPPTGIALVAFLLIGRRACPAIPLAAFAVNLPIGPTPLGAAIIAAGNTLAPLVSVELLRRAGFHRELDRLQDAIAIILIAALAGMTISATIGSSVLLLWGTIPATQFWPTWAVWWAGDAMGVLLVAPFLLSFLARPFDPAFSWRRDLELAGLLAGTAVLTYVLFQNRLRLEYLVLPVIMLTAWRFRLRGATAAALIASGIAVWSASNGSGPFADQTLFEKMVTLQVFNVSVAVVSFLLAAFVDEHERKEEMSRLYESAQLMSEAKTRFLDRWKKSLEILTGKTRELNRIVADLLEASRIEANALPRNLSQIDLRTVIEEARMRALPRAQLLDAEIATRLTADPVPVEADASQLGRILDNLINNGLSYSVRPPRLSITVSGEGDQAVARVADNGAGIPEHQQERFFDRFHRANEPAFRSVPGTGLGLYISRRLAEGHGGSLVVESSTPGAGTTVALALPLLVTAAPAALAPVGDPSKASSPMVAPTR